MNETMYPAYPGPPTTTPAPWAFDMSAELALIRRRRRLRLLIGALVVVGLLLAGTGYAGARAWYGWGAVEPEAAVPGDVLAFARVDLDPGYQQGVKLLHVVRKLPHSGGHDDARSSLMHHLLAGWHLDYDADVAPWFANRVGVAWWQDDKGSEVTLVALASKDDAKAGRALAKARPNPDGVGIGYAVHDGYALLALGGPRPQEDADAAAAAARQHSLARDASFTGAVGRLPGAHVAVGYADLTDLAAAYTSRFRAALGDAAKVQLPDLSKVTGILAVSAEAVDDGIAVHLSGPTAGAQLTGPADARALLDALPGDSGVAAALPGPLPKPEAEQLRPLLTAALTGLPAGEKDVTSVLRAQVDTVVDGAVALLTAKSLSFGITGPPGNGDPTGGVLNVQAADGTGARSISDAAKFFGGLSQSTPVHVEQQNDTVRVRVGTPGGGRLADRALYRQAMSGAFDRPQVAAYADITQLNAAGSPVKAVAVTIRTRGAAFDGLVHVVVG